MSDQIFKKKVDKELFRNFLIKYSEPLKENYFLINKNSYKRARYFQELSKFYDEIIDNYYKCKQKYIHTLRM